MTETKQLTTYVGCNSVIRESGYFKGITRISKNRNSHIRAALLMPAKTCVRCNPALRQFYNRLKPKKAKPLIVVSLKLLIRKFTLRKIKNFMM